MVVRTIVARQSCTALRHKCLEGRRIACLPCGNARPPVSEGPTPAQNLMLPIMLAMLVVRSLIVGAIVDEAR